MCIREFGGTPAIFHSAHLSNTYAWSIFSGLSLSNISAVAAIALPLYPNEVLAWQELFPAGRLENVSVKQLAHSGFRIKTRYFEDSVLTIK